MTSLAHSTSVESVMRFIDANFSSNLSTEPVAVDVESSSSRLCVEQEWLV